MKFLQWGTDGGKESGVNGFWLFEIKSLFSLVILFFNKGTRENYHSHAFNAYTFFIYGEIEEQILNSNTKIWKPSIYPKYTPKSRFHRVKALEKTCCISFRGPWQKYWYEYSPKNNQYLLLTNKRKIISTNLDKYNFV